MLRSNGARLTASLTDFERLSEWSSHGVILASDVPLEQRSTFRCAA
jgi:hypothetical protein